METWLIFQGQWECDGLQVLSGLIGLAVAAEQFLEIAPTQ